MVVAEALCQVSSWPKTKRPVETIVGHRRTRRTNQNVAVVTVVSHDITTHFSWMYHFQQPFVTSPVAQATDARGLHPLTSLIQSGPEIEDTVCAPQLGVKTYSARQMDVMICPQAKTSWCL